MVQSVKGIHMVTLERSETRGPDTQHAIHTRGTYLGKRVHERAKDVLVLRCVRRQDTTPHLHAVDRLGRRQLGRGDVE